MRDRVGLTIHDGDRVDFQHSPSSAVHRGTVVDATSARAKELDSVKVDFGGGHPQFIGGEHLKVVSE